jgi:hypothetical protein
VSYKAVIRAKNPIALQHNVAISIKIANATVFDLIILVLAVNSLDVIIYVCKPRGTNIISGHVYNDKS